MTATELDEGDDWVDLTTPTDERVLEVARAHGTVAAADWSGWSRPRVVELRKRVDGYDRGRGHPSIEEVAARSPRDGCSCTMCVEWRWQRITRLARLDEANATPTLVDTDARWMADALCRGADVDLWFPRTKKSGIAEPVEAWQAHDFEPAKRICDQCPVAAQCERYATVNGFDFGMWGGQRPVERYGTHAYVTAVRRRKRSA